MVKEIVFTCDPCADRTPATHVGLTVAIGHRKPKMLDLCDSHHEHLVAPVIEALASWGYTDDVPAKPKKTAAPHTPTHSDTLRHTPTTARRVPSSDLDGPYQCGLCEQQPKHRKSLSNHLRAVHGVTLAAYRVEHGDPVLVA